jgi:hypothetical protein
MSGLRILAIVLIVAGALALFVPSINFSTREEVLDVGPIEVTREERRSIPLSPLLGGAAIVIGIGLLVAGKRRAA